MARLDQEREAALQPKRVEFAVNKITELGYTIEYADRTKIIFIHKNNNITLFPYSGWFSGKGIKQGRGIFELIKQLKKDQ